MERIYPVHRIETDGGTILYNLRFNLEHRNYLIYLISQGDRKWYLYRHLIEEIKLQYSYPRLDINVSKGLNHLLKSPFCVHPKTGKICIPFNASAVDKFDPDKVPTIMTLIEEINAYDVKDKAEEETYELNKKRIKDYKKTSLNKSLHIFQEFLRHLEAERREQRLKGKSKRTIIGKIISFYTILYN